MNTDESILTPREAKIIDRLMHSTLSSKVPPAQKTLLAKDYDDESLYDLERDVSEAVDESHAIPKDEHGFRKGTFRVTITWHPPEDLLFASTTKPVWDGPSPPVPLPHLNTEGDE